MLSKALPDPALMEYTNVIIEQADRLRNLVDRACWGRSIPDYVTESIHKVAERVVKLVSMELCRITSNWSAVTTEPAGLPHDPDQIETGSAECRTQRCRRWGQKVARSSCAPYRLSADAAAYVTTSPRVLTSGTAGIPSLTGYAVHPMVSGREGGYRSGALHCHSLIDQHSGKIEFTSWRTYRILGVPAYSEVEVFMQRGIAGSLMTIAPSVALERALTGAGLSCTTFESGNEVLDALTTKTPDVLLSDIRMPEWMGWRY